MMMRLGKFFKYVFVLVLVTASVYLLAQMAAYMGKSLPLIGGARIGVVRVSGVIVSSAETIRQLRALDSDPSIKAIILRINSPGGAVVPSQDIYEEVGKIRAKGKPVISSIGTLGASGAYYIASGTDYIMASPGSLTGSIGVIMELAEFKDLLDKLGIKSEVLKAGAMKDAGSPFRPMTPAEQAYMQTLLANIHAQFINDVSKGRKIPVETLKPLADGRVFTGKMALGLHLVDGLGDYRDAVAKAQHLAHLSGTPELKEFPKKSFLDSVFSSKVSSYLTGVTGSSGGFWAIMPGRGF
ncbi:MAG: signal peptide peptidase SppA [Nitrospiraceae bacterium]|jgi:protease-4|nr:signal peptide peptidase SppA [Nitrospiraceae bacterium]